MRTCIKIMNVKSKDVNADPYMNSKLEENEPLGNEYGFLIENLNRIAKPLADVLELKAFEVYFSTTVEMQLERVYFTGKITPIWQQGAVISKESFLGKQYERNENRTINLPNRRIGELNNMLKDKAYGQVCCFPILLEHTPVGMICCAHIRRSMLTEREMNLLEAVSGWIAGIIQYERRSGQIRAEIITMERERIGMDLHDGIIQTLYGIGLSMENARMNLEQGKGNAIKSISKSLEAIQSAIGDIRAYILDLRPRQLQHTNLFEGMQSLAREFRANTMVNVDLDGKKEDVEHLARAQVDALFHIFQEALSNTAKHAGATSVSVRLWRPKDHVMLRINDNGEGFELPDPNKRIGHGLANMRARAESAGGGLEVVSIRHQGTILTTWVPFIPEKKE